MTKLEHETLMFILSKLEDVEGEGQTEQMEVIQLVTKLMKSIL